MRSVFRLNRVIPLLTILGAGVALVLSLLRVISFTLSESIIIAILALLATDSLSERMSVLEKIEARLEKISSGETLRSRTFLPAVELQAANASDIYILGVSGLGLINRNRGFFESKMMEGCNIHVILLDPKSPSLKTWDLISNPPMITPEADIVSGLQNFMGLAQQGSGPGRCEVRVLDVFLPFSIIATDVQRQSGTMVVEYHVYKRAPGERPHVYITPKHDPYWFNFYRQQLERAWANASPWTP